MKTEVFKTEEFVKCDKKLPVIVGEDENGKLIIEDLIDINNLMVVGQMGTPRCPFSHALVCGLSLKCSPEDVKMLLIDFMCIELEPYSHLPHTKFKLQNIEVDGAITGDYDKCLYALDRLSKECVYRYHKIKEHGTQNIEEYNKKAEDKIPYIVCVVEYPNRIHKKDISVVENYISQISQFSKDTGVCLVYTLNRITFFDDKEEQYEVLTKKMIDSLSSKMVFMIEDDKGLLKGYPTETFDWREYWFVKQNSSPQKIEMPFISDEEFNEIARKI